VRKIILIASLVTAALCITPRADAAGQPVLLVVANTGALTPAENVIAQRLATAGYDITFAHDDLVTAADASGKAFVLVAQSTTAANATNALRNVAVPIWVAKPYLFDDFGLTGSVENVDFGFKNSPATISIASPGHPMAAGRTGSVPFQNGKSLSWGKPTASATTIARAGTDATIFLVEAGDTLSTGQAAPACRLTFPLYTNGPTALTADGLAMFDAAANWAAANCTDVVPVDTPPQVTLTSPAAGATVQGVVTFTADATDDRGVFRVVFAVDGTAFETDSNGTNGWTGSWSSTSVGDGPHTISATATDTAGQTATSSITVTVANTTRPKVLMVVAAPANRTAAENLVAQRLTTAGHDVTFADDNTVTAADTADKAFVLVAQSTAAVQATNVLRNLAVPIWVAKPYLFDDFGLTGTAEGVDYGFKATSSVTITAPGHPMAAGRTGTISFQSGNSLSWGKPTASATTIARAGTDAIIFTVAPGAMRSTGGAAPACRLTFPLYTNGPTTLTADGRAMFDAAAHWAAANCTAGPPPPPPDGIEHVIQVSVDGLNPDAITQLGPAGTPAFHRLIAQGASTLNARTVVERTRTLPNHTSVMTGRPVSGTSGHQVTFNDDNGSTLAATAGSYIAGVFDTIHDRGGSTALYSGAPKLDFLDRSWNGTNGALDTIGVDNGRDKIDTYLRGAGSVTTPALLNQLGSDPKAFNFIHLASTDSVGHQYGFMSAQYLDAVKEVDAHIGQILDAVAGDPTLAGNTVVIVSADHGGLGLTHEDPTAIANYRIPFFVWGEGVAAGADLYALNPDRADPGSTQPAYTVAVQPIRNADSADLVTELLGLGPVPGSTINADQSLDIAP
jgi:Big-like domain-containing protein/type I phosphodiesterase/nucleotide pyrophosphatase